MTEEDMLSFAKDKYTPIPRISRIIPFGYKEDENDPNVLQPVPLELEALEQARKHLKNYSLRVVANWVSEVTGRYISHIGLKKRFESETRRRRKASATKVWAKKYHENLEKVRKYREQYLGAKENDSTE